MSSEIEAVIKESFTAEDYQTLKELSMSQVIENNLKGGWASKFTRPALL